MQRDKSRFPNACFLLRNIENGWHLLSALNEEFLIIINAINKENYLSKMKLDEACKVFIQLHISGGLAFLKN
jgi:hypothetical protein